MPMSGIEPPTYWLRISCSTPELHRHQNKFIIFNLFLSNSNKPESNLDPNLRARLLKETKNPYRGLRRAVWIALFGSAALGLFIMLTNIIAGDTVSINDLAIQASALLILGFLLFKDRSKEEANQSSRALVDHIYSSISSN